MSIPVILDTNIGTDIDDTWALVQLLKDPRCDLRLAVSATDDAVYRARLIARLLEIAGRTDVPVAVGHRGGAANLSCAQAGWLGDNDLTDYAGRVHEDGVAALVDAVMTAERPPVICAIGPLTNLAAALRREPRIAERSRVVAMAGSIDRRHGGAPGAIAEYNVQLDPAAAQAVFAAPWDITITPLDTCGTVVLERERLQRVHASDDRLLRALIANYRDWLGPDRQTQWSERSSILFDTVAVHLISSEAHLHVVDEHLRVDDAGFTRRDPHGRPVRVALDWTDREAYLDDLVEGLLGPTVPACSRSSADLRASPAPPR